MNYEITDLSTKSKTLCSNLRPAGLKMAERKKDQNLFIHKKITTSPVWNGYKKEIKKGKIHIYHV